MKCYKFVLNKWFDCPACLNDAVATVRDWVVENNYKKTAIYIKDDVYIYATDKDVIHMVITGHDWDDLPKTLDNRGSDILDFFIDVIANRHDDDYDPEEAFYNYITN